MDSDHPSTADLVIEVLSPRTEVYDRTTKADTYGALKVGELWLVDPASQSIEVLVWKADNEVYRHAYSSGNVLGSTVLKGLSLPIDLIWK